MKTKEARAEKSAKRDERGGKSMKRMDLPPRHREHREDLELEGVYTPVAKERVRKLLGAKGIAVRRCAKECVSA